MAPVDAVPAGWRPAAFNQGWTYHDQIRADEGGQWLTQLMSRRHPHSTAAQWQQRLEAGQLLLERGQSRFEGVLGGRCGNLEAVRRCGGGHRTILESFQTGCQLGEPP